MFLKLAFLFIAMPFIEVMVLVKMGQQIGFVDTMLIVILTGVLGAVLARWQGVKVWWAIQRELQQGMMPASKMIDGLLIFAAGLVLITPGLLTDLLGFLLLIPASRDVFKKWLYKKLEAMSERRQGRVFLFLE